MTLRTLFLATLCVLLQACVATGFTLVAPGSVAIGDLSVNASAGYNLAPAISLPAQRKGAQTWTRDGMLLDRITFVPAVADGEALLTSRQKDAALPVFRKDMLPNEIEELLESTIVKEFGEGNAVVSTSNLRPNRYGEHRGILFDVSATVTESPEYKGIVGAFVADERLYVMWFFAADPYYFDKHVAAATAIISSARKTAL